MGSLTAGQRRTLAAVEGELGRLIRYDDESLVHDAWIRQRYDGGFAASYAPARAEAVRTAWHEAGHAVAAPAVGARFSSASIPARGAPAGPAHRIQGGGGLAVAIGPARPGAGGPRLGKNPGRVAAEAPAPQVIGMAAITVAPRRGADRISRVPPTSSARSVMLGRPKPPVMSPDPPVPAAVTVNPSPSSLTRKVTTDSA